MNQLFARRLAGIILTQGRATAVLRENFDDDIVGLPFIRGACSEIVYSLSAVFTSGSLHAYVLMRTVMRRRVVDIARDLSAYRAHR